MTSGIVGPDGKTPIQSDAPQFDYHAGGLKIRTPMVPDAMLTDALQRAQQTIGNQIYGQVLKKTGSAVAAQTEAQTAVAGIGDPFTLEPCAAAVFMYLAREVEYRDLIIEQLNERLVSLGAQPLDVEHPYPLPPEPEPGEGEQEGANGEQDPPSGEQNPPDGEQEGDGGDEEPPLIVTS